MSTISCYPCHWCGCSENQCECTPGKKCCPDCDHRTLLERAERVIENGNSDSLFRELVAEIKGNEQQLASMNLDCANISHNLQLANVGINMVTAERDTLRAEVEKLRGAMETIRTEVVGLGDLVRKYNANHLTNHARGVAHAQRDILAVIAGIEP